MGIETTEIAGRYGYSVSECIKGVDQDKVDAWNEKKRVERELQDSRVVRKPKRMVMPSGLGRRDRQRWRRENAVAGMGL